jgi:hypothetical protein
MNVGYGFGFTAGDFTRILQVQKGDASSVKQISLYPSFNFRAGNLKKVFLEYKFAQLFPTSFPALNHHLAVGFGVGRNRKAALRFGTASNCGLLISASFPMGGHLMCDIYTGAGGGLFNSYDHTNNTLAALNLHYKFNKIEKR